jgi:hypothetical protein
MVLRRVWRNTDGAFSRALFSVPFRHRVCHPGPEDDVEGSSFGGVGLANLRVLLQRENKGARGPFSTFPLVPNFDPGGKFSN